MQRKRAFGVFALAGAMALMATTAMACPNCKKGYVFGPPVAVGNGMAFSYVKFNKDTKKIESMGVTFTESALEGLPTVEQMDPKMPAMEYRLEVPKEVKGLPWDHITIDWNPIGHEPAKIYDVPHFDIHFYTISQAEKSTISFEGPAMKTGMRKPDAQFIPAGFILPPGTAVPQMGVHWIDPKSPEFSGKPFSTTFLYGTYAGKSLFWEPMITHEFLSSKPNFSQPIGTPQAYQAAGYYPSAYSIKYNADRREISVGLDGLTYSKGAVVAAAPQPSAKVVSKPSKLLKKTTKSGK